MSHYAVIVAGGAGKRMGADIPKQFLLLGGRPILMHTIERFVKYDPKIKVILVLQTMQIERWKRLCLQYEFTVDHQIVRGGATRWESVRNGLAHIEDDGIVAIHDGVRPLVSTQTIKRAFIEAAAYGSAIPVRDSSESIRVVDDGGISHAVNRSNVLIVQTPQTFKTGLILDAYKMPYRDNFTDDASVVEAAGAHVHLTHGNLENVKITTRDDLLYAEAVLAEGLVE